jgi:hypothetical protein
MQLPKGVDIECAVISFSLHNARPPQRRKRFRQSSRLNRRSIVIEARLQLPHCAGVQNGTAAVEKHKQAKSKDGAPDPGWRPAANLTADQARKEGPDDTKQ